MRTIELKFKQNNLIIEGCDYHNLIAELFGVSAHRYFIAIDSINIDLLRRRLKQRFPEKAIWDDKELLSLIKRMVSISSSVQPFIHFLENESIPYKRLDKAC